MSSVFVVVAGINYEGSTPIHAFDDNYLAKEFARECREYEATRPKYPRSGGKEEIDEWSAADKAWIAAHPGGENAEGSDYFVVREVPFGAASQPHVSKGEEGNG